MFERMGCLREKCNPTVLAALVPSYRDNRGDFLKFFEEDGSNFEVKEAFVSFTKKGFLRGIHLQTGPFACDRRILIRRGSVHTVFLDLRSNSGTKHQVCEYISEGDSNRLFWVPAGVGHGFQALTDAEIIYLSGSTYSPNYDSGVHPLSLGIAWKMPVAGISPRDANLPTVEEFLSSN